AGGNLPDGSHFYDPTMQELVIDLTPPSVSVNQRLTNDTTPALFGTVGDPFATVDVSVLGQHRLARNNRDGTWTLPRGLLSVPSAGDNCPIIAVATDRAGNASAASNRLYIDLTPPLVTVNPRTTNDLTPALSGTINDPTAMVRVTVNGIKYDAVNNGTSWSLA